MRLDDIEIVLVRPARPANLAAACRALKNMGLTRLRLVDPPRGLEHPQARSLAYGAWDVLDRAIRHASLAEAVAQSILTVATSGRPDPGAWTPRHFAADQAAQAGGGRISIVFGPESTGLTNDELALCHRRIRIPTGTAHPSLNLAQAVLIVAYELRLATETVGLSETSSQEPVRASVAEVEEALTALREGLLAIGYLNPQNPGAILAELRGLLDRAAPTPRELVLLRGIARQVQWAAERIARNDSGSG